MQSDLIPKIATGFCGGMSRTDGLCGALIGGIMALGILFGRNSAGDSHYKIYALTERLIHDFENHFGSRNCSDLLGCDISTNEGDAIFKRDQLGETFCLDVTVKTTAMVLQVLEDQDDIKHTLIKH
ncbi:MAG: C_GCAxxG_C_C family protein [Desulfobacterales bacterium]|nr:MAG: C_GCAxxG_C_C family protein [Desulfobacterales bacterium]